MKRRYLFCFLLVGLLCVLVPQLALGSFAAEPLSGACGDAILWSLDPDTGTLTVSGTGDMWDYGFSDYPFKDYRKDIRSVVISEGITHIGDHAFYNLSLKAPLSIPSSVKTIGSYAFASLVGVQSITIPYGVTSIGERAFECGYMTSISVPESVTFLGEGVFEDCLYLTSVNIPSGITELSPCLFQNCVHLQTVTLPSKLKTIGEFAFKGCKKLYDLNFPETLTDISLGAFAYCSLFSCVLPDTVRIIGADAFLHAFDYDYAFYMEEPYFYSGKHLIAANPSVSGDVSIRPDTLTIACGAFEGNKNITSVTIPDSVLTIGAAAFMDCSNLASITIPDSVQRICNYAFSGTAFYKNSANWDNDRLYIGNHLILLENKTDKYILIREGTRTLADYSLHFYERCEVLILPSSLTYVGASNFFGCSNASFPPTRHIDVYILTPFCNIKSEGPYDSTHNITIHGSNYGTAKSYAQNAGRPFVPICTCTYRSATSIAEVTQPGCETKGQISLRCKLCGKSEVIYTIASTGHKFRNTEVVTPPTCTEKGTQRHTCTVCGYSFTQAIAAKGHTYAQYESNGMEHKVICTDCGESYTEEHSYTEGLCVCGAQKLLSEETTIYHTLSLVNDISINYLVPSSMLEGYDSYYMEILLPEYEGDEQISTTCVKPEPVQNGGYTYFTLEGLRATEMTVLAEATLYMAKGDILYYTEVDRYCIASYAYKQLNNPGASDKLKAVCANLLQYGAMAQRFKEYHTKDLADANMTEAHRSFLTDLDSVSFNDYNTILEDIEVPTVTWAGKSLTLGSRVELRYVVDLSAYEGTMEDLRLRVSYEDQDGATVTVEVKEIVTYDESACLYAFDFNSLRASELRAVLSAAVYAGDIQVSPTLEYSVDTYCNNKTGTLGDLCKALIAYSDSAYAMFQK